MSSARRSACMAVCVSPSASATGARRVGRSRVEETGVEIGGDGGQLLGSLSGGGEVFDRKHDLHEGDEQTWPLDRIVVLGHHAADRRFSGGRLALGEAKLGKARLRFATPFARRPVVLLGIRERAAQAVQLSLLVQCFGDCLVRGRLQQPFAGALHLRRTRRPTHRPVS